MKLHTCILLSLLGPSLAQRWKLDGACSKYDAVSIEAAFKEAVMMAENAWDVISNNYDTDAHVQQMVKYILGDGADFQGKVDKAKEILEAVKSYDTASYPFLGAPFLESTDLLIFCDDSNYQTVTGVDGENKYENKAIGAFVEDTAKRNIRLCHDSNTRPNAVTAIPMAITICSDGFNKKKYDADTSIWKQAGALGPEPVWSDYIIPQKDKPNTMDLCTWYLGEKQGEGWPKVDADMIAKVQSDAFIAGLQGNDKAVDILATTLGATFLHELTHTNFGGRTYDHPGEQGCYGWVCVGALHDPSNADSINILGVAMTVWKLGFYIDNEGLIKKLP